MPNRDSDVETDMRLLFKAILDVRNTSKDEVLVRPFNYIKMEQENLGKYLEYLDGFQEYHDIQFNVLINEEEIKISIEKLKEEFKEDDTVPDSTLKFAEHKEVFQDIMLRYNELRAEAQLDREGTNPDIEMPHSKAPIFREIEDFSQTKTCASISLQVSETIGKSDKQESAIIAGELKDSSEWNDDTKIPYLLQQKVLEVGDSIKKSGVIHENKAGSTALLTHISTAAELTIANVGDSRAVLFIRKEDGSVESKRLTADHKSTDVLERLRAEKEGKNVVEGRVSLGSREPDIYQYDMNKIIKKAERIEEEEEEGEKKEAQNVTNVILLSSCAGMYEKVDERHYAQALEKWFKKGDEYRQQWDNNVAIFLQDCGLQTGSEENITIAVSDLTKLKTGELTAPSLMGVFDGHEGSDISAMAAKKFNEDLLKEGAICYYQREPLSKDEALKNSTSKNGLDSLDLSRDLLQDTQTVQEIDENGRFTEGKFIADKSLSFLSEDDINGSYWYGGTSVFRVIKSYAREAGLTDFASNDSNIGGAAFRGKKGVGRVFLFGEINISQSSIYSIDEGLEALDSQQIFLHRMRHLHLVVKDEMQRIKDDVQGFPAKVFLPMSNGGHWTVLEIAVSKDRYGRVVIDQQYFDPFGNVDVNDLMQGAVESASRDVFKENVICNAVVAVNGVMQDDASSCGPVSCFHIGQRIRDEDPVPFSFPRGAKNLRLNQLQLISKYSKKSEGTAYGIYRSVGQPQPVSLKQHELNDKRPSQIENVLKEAVSHDGQADLKIDFGDDVSSEDVTSVDENNNSFTTKNDLSVLTGDSSQSGSERSLNFGDQESDSFDDVGDLDEESEAHYEIEAETLQYSSDKMLAVIQGYANRAGFNTRDRNSNKYRDKWEISRNDGLRSIIFGETTHVKDVEKMSRIMGNLLDGKEPFLSEQDCMVFLPVNTGNHWVMLEMNISKNQQGEMQVERQYLDPSFKVLAEDKKALLRDFDERIVQSVRHSLGGVEVADFAAAIASKDRLIQSDMNSSGPIACFYAQQGMNSTALVQESCPKGAAALRMQQQELMKDLIPSSSISVEENAKLTGLKMVNPGQAQGVFKGTGRGDKYRYDPSSFEINTNGSDIKKETLEKEVKQKIEEKMAEVLNKAAESVGISKLQAINAIHQARQKGGVAHAYDKADDIYLEQKNEGENFLKLARFSRLVQKGLGEAGIYSGRERKLHQPIVGLRTAFIPAGALEKYQDLEENLDRDSFRFSISTGDDGIMRL